jgi:hypothetical protein
MDFSVLHSREKKLSRTHFSLAYFLGYIISGDLENPGLNELKQDVWNRFLVQLVKKILFCYLLLHLSLYPRLECFFDKSIPFLESCQFIF